MTEQLIQLTMEDQVAVLRLNRPEKFNSFVRPMALALIEVLDQCDADDTVRAVVITGTGKAFCAYHDFILQMGISKKVIFLHTGGVFGAFSKRNEYLNFT